jgi:hypothetical protein
LQELVGLSAQALSNRICSKIVLQLFQWQSLTTGRSVYSPGIRIGMRTNREPHSSDDLATRHPQFYGDRWSSRRFRVAVGFSQKAMLP